MNLSTSLLFALAVQDPGKFPEELQVRALAATVRVFNATRKSEGSGVIVGRTGAFVYVLTAYHIVAGADDVEITVFPRKSDAKVAKDFRKGLVVARSADLRDLALIRIVSDEKTVMSVQSIYPARETPKTDGFPALALGCSAGQPPTAIVHNELSKKKVRQKEDAKTTYCWETPGTVAKGRSGGPLIDKRGFVVGICSGTNDGKGYYAHTEEIHRFLKQHGFHWLAEKDG